MNKTIWIINDYAGSPYHGMVFRHYYLAKEWIKLGYNVYIITASYSHYFKNLPQINSAFTFEKIDGINYIWVKVPHYNNSTDKKRVLKWFVFTAKLFFLPLNKIEKPDVIIASPTAPFFVIPVYKLSKKFNAKFIFEVRDIWPLSIIELGNISPNNPLIKAMSWCEKFAINKSDFVVSSLQNYGEYLKDLGIKKDFVWINNGISLEEMNNVEELPKDIEEKLPKDKFIVGYTGTVGIANALEYFCEAAKILKDNKKISFVIVGNGKLKSDLIKKYGNLNNIIFIDSIPKKQVQSMLKNFDACYIGLRKEKLFRYGVSPNKLFDYMYSGKPIIYAIDSGKANIVNLYNCGITVEPENPKAIAEGVLKLYNLSKQDREEMGKRGREAVIEHFTYEKLAKKYANLF